MAQRCRISCSGRPEHCSRISSIIVNGSSSSRINIRCISRCLAAISLKFVMTLLSDVTTHGFPVTLTSMTSNDSSSVRLRCEFGIDLGNVTEVTLGRNETETGRWEILFVYSTVDNTTNQFMNSWAGRASASVVGSHADITIGNATPWDCGLFGCQVTNRLNEQQRNFTRIEGCAAFDIVNITSTTLSPWVPISSKHLPVWATVLIVLAVVVVVVLVVSGLIVAAFKFKGNGNQVSPDYDGDLSAERNHHLTTGATDDQSATKGAADNRKKRLTKRRRGDGEQSLGYSSSHDTSNEDNVDRFTFQQQKKKYRQTPENSPTSSRSSTKASHAEDAAGSKKRRKRRQSRMKSFDDEEIAEEEEEQVEEKPSASQNSDVEASARKTQQRGNALPPLQPEKKKKKKKRKVEEEPMAVMYKD